MTLENGGKHVTVVVKPVMYLILLWHPFIHLTRRMMLMLPIHRHKRKGTLAMAEVIAATAID